MAGSRSQNPGENTHFAGKTWTGSAERWIRFVDTEHVAWVLQLLCGKVLGRKIYSNDELNS